MSNILFYLLFAILLYFVLSRVFEKFNLEQENFDPSLVPVSSIVTLAKVAQKLVNGNGVLTNPGSLQIGGSSSAPGNLTVTGNTQLNSAVTINSGSMPFKIKSGLASPFASKIEWGDSSGWITRFQLNDDRPLLDINDSGPIRAYGDLTVDGAIKFKTGRWHTDENNNKRLHFGGPNADTFFGSPNNRHIFRNGADRDIMTLDNGNLSVTGEITGTAIASRNSTTGNHYRFIPGGSVAAGGVSADALNLYAYGRTTGQHIADFYDNGDTILFGNTSILKDLNVTGSTNTGYGKWNRSTEGANRVYYDQGNGTNPSGSITQPAAGATYYGSGNGEFAWRKNTDGTMDASKSNTMFLSNTGNLSVTGGVNINGTSGSTTMPEVGNLTMNNSIKAGNISIGPYSDPAHDVIRSNASSGLLVTSSSKKIYIWGDNNLYAQNGISINSGVEPKKGELCIGNTCINEDNLKVIKGQSYLQLKQVNSNNYLGRNLGDKCDSNTRWIFVNANNHGYDSNGWGQCNGTDQSRTEVIGPP